MKGSNSNGSSQSAKIIIEASDHCFGAGAARSRIFFAGAGAKAWVGAGSGTRI